MVSFDLNEKEEATLNEWKEAIKKVFGEYSYYEYRFRPTGIGTGISVWSDLAKKEIDLTDVDSW